METKGLTDTVFQKAKSKTIFLTLIIMCIMVLVTNVSHAQDEPIANPSGTYCFKNDIQRMSGNGSSMVRHYSNHSNITQHVFYDKEETMYGCIYGRDNGASFGFLDGDGNWSYKAVKDNHTIFLINNKEKMRIMSDGKLGIGTDSPKGEVHVGERLMINSPTSGGWGGISNNIYLDGGLKRVASGKAADMCFTDDGRIVFRTSPSAGAENSPITDIAHNMEILSSGGVSVNDKLNVTTAAGKAIIRHRVHPAYNTYQFMSMQLHSEDQGGFHVDDLGRAFIGTNDPCQVIDVNQNTDVKFWVFGEEARKGGNGFWTGLSDKRLKKNIAPMEESLSKLMKVPLYSYEYKESGKFQYGIMAQEMQEFFPKSVGSTGKKGEEYLTFNPNNLMFTGLKATQEIGKLVLEQEEEINTLMAENQILKARLEAERNRNDQQQTKLEAIEAALANQGIDLSDAQPANTSIGIQAQDDNPRLEQNIPNPFSYFTTISYYLPENTQIATLLIQDMSGKTIAKRDLPNQQGVGRVQVNVEDAQLQKGTFTYSLYVNQQLIDTKKMLLSK